uniref:Uncharacterized protein n=1 Tax=Anopheles darlingi TaxID=43151 RepID=A0A2M4DRK5_ANODA
MRFVKAKLNIFTLPTRVSGLAFVAVLSATATTLPFHFQFHAVCVEVELVFSAYSCCFIYVSSGEIRLDM